MESQYHNFFRTGAPCLRDAMQADMWPKPCDPVEGALDRHLGLSPGSVLAHQARGGPSALAHPFPLLRSWLVLGATGGHSGGYELPRGKTSLGF